MINNKTKNPGYTKLPYEMAMNCELSDDAHRVQAILARYHKVRPSQKIEPAYIGIKKIRALTGMSIKAIKKALCELTIVGLLTTTRKWDGVAYRMLKFPDGAPKDDDNPGGWEWAYIPNELINRPDLSSAQFRASVIVLADTIRNTSSKRKGYCWRSIEEISARCGWSLSKAKRIIKSMVDAGALKVLPAYSRAKSMGRKVVIDTIIQSRVDRRRSVKRSKNGKFCCVKKGPCGESKRDYTRSQKGPIGVVPKRGYSWCQKGPITKRDTPRGKNTTMNSTTSSSPVHQWKGEEELRGSTDNQTRINTTSEYFILGTSEAFVSGLSEKGTYAFGIPEGDVSISGASKGDTSEDSIFGMSDASHLGVSEKGASEVSEESVEAVVADEIIPGPPVPSGETYHQNTPVERCDDKTPSPMPHDAGAVDLDRIFDNFEMLKNQNDAVDESPQERVNRKIVEADGAPDQIYGTPGIKLAIQHLRPTLEDIDYKNYFESDGDMQCCDVRPGFFNMMTQILAKAEEECVR